MAFKPIVLIVILSDIITARMERSAIDEETLNNDFQSDDASRFRTQEEILQETQNFSLRDENVHDETEEVRIKKKKSNRGDWANLHTTEGVIEFQEISIMNQLEQGGDFGIDISN